VRLVGHRRIARPDLGEWYAWAPVKSCLCSSAISASGTSWRSLLASQRALQPFLGRVVFHLPTVLVKGMLLVAKRTSTLRLGLTGSLPVAAFQLVG